MREQRDIACWHSIGLDCLRQRVDYALSKIIRRGQCFGDTNGAAFLVDQSGVRKRASNIDANPPAHVFLRDLVFGRRY